jgi:hypothetical protein
MRRSGCVADELFGVDLCAREVFPIESSLCQVAASIDVGRARSADAVGGRSVIGGVRE